MMNVMAFIDPTAPDPEILTPENYEELTHNRTIFVKFFSPKCKHCVEMAPIWEAVSKSYGGKRHGLIGAVDCNGAGRDLCRRFGIGHLPSLLWGDPIDLQPYTGGPQYEELIMFARKNLKPFCTPNPYRRKFCSEDENKTISEYESMYEEGTLNGLIEEGEKKLDELYDKFAEQVSELNDKANQHHNVKKAAFNEESLYLLKSVRGYKKLLKIYDNHGNDETDVKTRSHNSTMLLKEEL